ncbi:MULTISPECIES: DUF1810 domain-containing protein [Methylobacterium]|jgi:uncharacterized protein (DUF1810 family)|uniref:DUF1810 domain-containing protein n=1 Tax=Methylobacterium longum TaxID=767694 RepID=A0ABT8AIC7_9HYPH|nr:MULTISPECIES: DUF1810 domain-containing protein [Methylobacterium]MCJ2100407.1 DUF1810 domain-containing protein [Methylobacterium sp. E-046]MDN3569520.1 DUF1810 domain-containing protein [Methylobacterium longum]GJE10737.1 hypothetical protein FOHLNKBM_1774 [Methylobacterium longum]
MNDAYDLGRFVAAQEGIYPRALAELQAGEKRSHWMWFIFPQIAGLGLSSMARRYAIRSLDEGRAYLGHPLLGPRLRACTAAVNALSGRSANAIFGTPDDVKFRSSMTLFAAAAPEEPCFAEALAHYFAGSPDPLTLEKLG